MSIQLQLLEKTLIIEADFRFIPNINQIVVVVRDITKQKQDQQALSQETSFVRIHQKVAVAANQSQTLEEAINICLELLCVYMAWPVGHVYFVSHHSADQLVPSDIWFLSNHQQFAEFRASTSQTIKRRQGLPGEVLETK